MKTRVPFLSLLTPLGWATVLAVSLLLWAGLFAVAGAVVHLGG